jgi:hypothetical protein
MDDQPDFGFDLAAASLRADEPDLARAIEIFASKLETALPTACRVKRRRRWPLSRESRVASLDIDLGELSFHLSSSRKGRIVAERTERVHDMSRRTDALSVADWLRGLEDALRDRAASSSEARAALEELLEG